MMLTLVYISHFLIITPGSHLMSDILLMSPILRDPSDTGAPGGLDAAGDIIPGVTGSGGPGGAGGSAFEFGFDPNLDPELALVRFIPFIHLREYSLTNDFLL
jgi:26S proteasome regulatory subunit N10